MPFFSLRGAPKKGNGDGDKPSTPQKPSSRGFLTVSPRKGLASLFGGSVAKNDNPEPDDDAAGSARSVEETSIAPTPDSAGRRRSYIIQGSVLTTPSGEAAHQKQSPATQRTFLDVLAKAIRAPAALFYKDDTPGTESKDATPRSEDSPTKSPHSKSDKTAKPDKGKSMALSVEPTSPIDIPSRNAPLLPPLMLHGNPFEDVSQLMGTTGRPVETPMLERVFGFRDSPISDRHPPSDFTLPSTPHSTTAAAPAIPARTVEPVEEPVESPSSMRTQQPSLGDDHETDSEDDGMFTNPRPAPTPPRAPLTPMGRRVSIARRFGAWRDRRRDVDSSSNDDSPVHKSSAKARRGVVANTSTDPGNLHQTVRHRFRKALNLTEETNDDVPTHLQRAGQASRSSSAAMKTTEAVDAGAAIAGGPASTVNTEIPRSPMPSTPSKRFSAVMPPAGRFLQWSPFTEPLFIDAGNAALQVAEKNFRRLLVKEKAFKRFWKVCGLPAETAPPSKFPALSDLHAGEICRMLVAKGPIWNTYKPGQEARIRAYIQILQNSGLLDSAAQDTAEEEDKSNIARTRANTTSEESDTTTSSEMSTLNYPTIIAENDPAAVEPQALDPKDLNSKEITPKEVGEEEVTPKELDPVQVKPKAIVPKVVAVKEVDAKEVDQKEVDPKVVDAGEVASKGVDPKEADLKEVVLKEVDRKPIAPRDLLNLDANTIAEIMRSDATTEQEHKKENILPAARLPSYALTSEKLRMSTEAGETSSARLSRLPIRKRYGNGGSMTTIASAEAGAEDPNEEMGNGGWI